MISGAAEAASAARRQRTSGRVDMATEHYRCALLELCLRGRVGREFVDIFAIDEAGDDLLFAGARVDPGDGDLLRLGFGGGRGFFGLLGLGAFGAEAFELVVGPPPLAMETRLDGGETGGMKDADGGLHGLGVEIELQLFGAEGFPLGVGHLVNQVLFGVVARLVVGLDAGVEGVEFGGVLVGEDEGAGAEAMAEGVEAGAGFAGGGAGAGGFFGVAAIGRDLLFSCHDVFPFFDIRSQKGRLAGWRGRAADSGRYGSIGGDLDWAAGWADGGRGG